MFDTLSAALVDLLCGVALGVVQRLHGRDLAIENSAHQGGAAVGVLQVDARAAPQQLSYHRLQRSRGGNRCAFELCAARVHAAALVQAPHAACQHRLYLAFLAATEYTIGLLVHSPLNESIYKRAYFIEC